MSMPSTHEITALLVAWGGGDQAALEKLTPLVYHELHRLAERYMKGERRDHTLQTTALVNEVYMRLIDWQNVEWQNRAHFFGVSAKLMRHILVKFARDRLAAKRGGDACEVSLAEAADMASTKNLDLVALDDALNTLAALAPRQSQIIELRFFGGLSLEETAEALNVSPATVRLDWSLAKAWLRRELKRGGRRDA
jgi:RNA polymerase sigma factor (TIGR02999 family)